jgi:2-polyprenyl-6-methoxyphenol hydroxylase-like FAD-dependent oxidoreductase
MLTLEEAVLPVDLPRVVIVGGGFGGLYAARTLAGAPVRITLIDRRNYHLFRPMLYQVATGLLSADEIAGPLRSILSHRNVEVLLDDVGGVFRGAGHGGRVRAGNQRRSRLDYRLHDIEGFPHIHLD